LRQARILPADAEFIAFARDDATEKPIRFLRRDAASLLVARMSLHQGSVLVVPTHDRIFTSVCDACEGLEKLNAIGVRLIILDIGLDLGRPSELLLPMTAMMKALRIRERRRTKEEFARRKRCGLPAGGKPPIGWEMFRAQVGSLDQAYFIPDERARRVAQCLVEHYDRWGGTVRQTAQWLNAHGVRRPDGRRWRKTAVHNWYLACKAGFPLPNGRCEAFPIPADAKPSRRCRTIAEDDD